MDLSGWLRRSTSSRRYKTDIRTMPDYGALFDSFKPIVYKPIDGEEVATATIPV